MFTNTSIFVNEYYDDRHTQQQTKIKNGNNSNYVLYSDKTCDIQSIIFCNFGWEFLAVVAKEVKKTIDTLQEPVSK